jgi:MazG family protein
MPKKKSRSVRRKLAEPQRPIDRLLAVMDRLRDPKGGCPWDREQTFASIVPHTIEEAYEVAEAVEQGDMEAFMDELGDLLFQVVFYAQLAGEAGLFDFEAVAAAIAEKMERRHPHVFGKLPPPADASAQVVAWEALKNKERVKNKVLKAMPTGRTSALDGVSVTLPALTRAGKLQKRAARVGFDWPSAPPVLDKLAEEAAELRREMADRPSIARKARMAEEVGDILFTCVNLARKLDIEPETALRQANRKFEKRFRRVEALLSGKLGDAGRMETAWEQAKREERRKKKRASA